MKNKKEYYLQTAKKIDRETCVDCQELVIDIYNDNLIENKIEKGKAYALGIFTGVMFSILIVRILQIGIK